MNLAGLDFDKIPPFSVPMRFFLVATLFAFVSAFIIVMAGESLWLSRWHPATLALTHAIVIGVISMIMCGAILQLLPVLAGKSLPYVQPVSILTLSGLGLGSLLLVSAFWFSSAPMFKLALILLSCVFFSFFCALLWVIKQRSKNSFSVNTLRL
ncbi:MAG: putative membrane protein, partial [Paraglaciecola sp.]